MADLSPEHMQARTVLCQLVNYVRVDAIYTPTPIHPKFFIPLLLKFNALACFGGHTESLSQLEIGIGEYFGDILVEEKSRSILIPRIQGVHTGKLSCGYGIIVKYGALYFSYSSSIWT